MQGFALLLQDRPIGHILGQGMLEDVFNFGERRVLIEELLRLKR